MGKREKPSQQEASPKAPRKVSIRLRIASAMVLMVVLALLVTGTIVVTLEQRTGRAELDADLLRTHDELALLAADGVNPDTGERFSGPSDLLRTFLTRNIIDDDEGELGIVEGAVRWVTHEEVSVRPEKDPELMEYILPLSANETTQLGTIKTSMATYRYHLTPVKFPQESGALLSVYNLDTAEESVGELVWIFLWAAIAISVLSTVVAWVLVGRLLRPIEDLRKAADSISETDLTSRVPLRGNDDLTQLSRTVNRMLDRVETSMTTQRALLDDVGHELRTPITVVRGHLELVDANDPTDVKQTKDLAIDELDRMSSLVGDLLVLAKANQSDFVQPQWFSLATLTDQTLEKARALGNRKWRLRTIESIEAWFDPERMTQAWLQLCANAVKYSSEDSAITLGSKLVRGEVHLFVEDQGVGIAPDELEKVRQRFGRGSNTSRVSGAGLGLSIVETILQAHNGRLDIESEVGVGSTFTMVIPLNPLEEESNEHNSDR